MVPPEFQMPNHRDANGEYLPVSIEGLLTGLAQELELFVRAGNAFFLVKPRNMALTPALVGRFLGKFPYLYISRLEREKYYKSLESNISSIVNSSSFSVREKASVLNDYAVEIVDRLLKDPQSATAMVAAKDLSEETVKFISQQKHAFIHLVELSNHDQYTYAHSVGVSAYCASLAMALGRWTKEEISNIALAGLLHDIGKCMVDPAIINKEGPLSPTEWEQMKKHPSFGYEILIKHKNLDQIVPLVAEAHHEDLLGRGYPKGLIISKLDPAVQVSSIADAFSALTTKRSYSPPRDSLSALGLMRESIGKKFDPHYFEIFIKMFLDPTKKDSEDTLKKLKKAG
jgi:putative nucleotidyltransferase with HDIG domain